MSVIVVGKKTAAQKEVDKGERRVGYLVAAEKLLRWDIKWLHRLSE